MKSRGYLLLNLFNYLIYSMSEYSKYASEKSWNYYFKFVSKSEIKRGFLWFFYRYWKFIQWLYFYMISITIEYFLFSTMKWRGQQIRALKANLYTCIIIFTTIYIIKLFLTRFEVGNTFHLGSNLAISGLGWFVLFSIKISCFPPGFILYKVFSIPIWNVCNMLCITFYIFLKSSLFAFFEFLFNSI